MTQTESSKRWLKRQEADPFVKRARAEGYRSRAVYKLLEIDARYKILQGAKVIVDLGAAPGSWSQVLAQKCGQCSEKTLIALDKLPIVPIEGITFLQGDLEKEVTLRSFACLLQGQYVDVVLSDMAPNTTGHARTDHLKNIVLVEEAYAFAVQHLSIGGRFVAKVFQGGTESGVLTILKQDFEKVFHVKPKASRPESREVYVVAIGFRRKLST
ncbi:MAG: RlmE family RNA methyltransferase [Holosporales bacterium]|jgi:23S rRNA (uridine2552-2'-O)-methyltransferase|nr:RlmE family RNA methyltransferase [Holosporales bacterium]